MIDQPPFRVLVAGGGPAAVEAVLTLHELAPDIAVELLAPGADLVYRPLSVAEPFARPGVRRYPLARLGELGVTVRRDALAAVRVDDRVAVTAAGDQLGYDALLVATGAGSEPGVPHGITFAGPEAPEAVHGLIQDLEGGYVQRVGFVAPAGASWTLPIYELALQAAERVADGSLHGATLTVCSHEARPLEALGPNACDLAERLLDEAGVRFVCGPASGGADRTVALPIAVGRRTPGLPADADGFHPVDEHARVIGAPAVWAAGDGTDLALKQGGLATQQAEAAARSIARHAEWAVDPAPFEPVLRALLLTGRAGWYLRRRLDGTDRGQVSDRALWWPPTKIAGRRLAPFLDAIDAATAAPRLERRLAARGRS